MTDHVTVAAPAKVNLYLAVGAPREDGFHPVATVYHALDLCDELVLRPARRTSVTVVPDGVRAAGVPGDARNLAVRAVDLLARHHQRDLPVELTIRKRIPVAGGLAGGSADAAAALVGADALFGLGTPRQALHALAARLGSDVPFSLAGATAVGTGRGEVLQPVPTGAALWWVVVPDAGELATPAVYAEFDRLVPAPPDPEIPGPLLAALAGGDVDQVGARLHNALQPAACSLRPDLARRLAAADGLAVASLVSGSGPTTVFLCRGPAHADEVRSALRSLPGVDLALVARGPASGARVLPEAPDEGVGRR